MLSALVVVPWFLGGLMYLSSVFSGVVTWSSRRLLAEEQKLSNVAAAETCKP